MKMDTNEMRSFLEVQVEVTDVRVDEAMETEDQITIVKAETEYESSKSMLKAFDHMVTVK